MKTESHCGRVGSTFSGSKQVFMFWVPSENPKGGWRQWFVPRRRIKLRSSFMKSLFNVKWSNQRSFHGEEAGRRGVVGGFGSVNCGIGNLVSFCYVVRDEIVLKATPCRARRPVTTFAGPCDSLNGSRSAEVWVSHIHYDTRNLSSRCPSSCLSFRQLTRRKLV